MRAGRPPLPQRGLDGRAQGLRPDPDERKGAPGPIERIDGAGCDTNLRDATVEAGSGELRASYECCLPRVAGPPEVGVLWASSSGSRLIRPVTRAKWSAPCGSSTTTGSGRNNLAVAWIAAVAACCRARSCSAPSSQSPSRFRHPHRMNRTLHKDGGALGRAALDRPSLGSAPRARAPSLCLGGVT
jgi:hypothetical protein